MNENELLREIVRIVYDAKGLSAALNRIESLFASECGGALLILRPESEAGKASLPSPLCEFLESREFPFRGLYTALVRAGGFAHGTLLACIGTWGVSGEALRRITSFTGRQLTGLASRLSVPLFAYEEVA